MRKPILLLDFDGVIHSYTSGWQGADFAGDPPVRGAAEFIRAALRDFTVMIYSSRSQQDGGIAAMMIYLEERVGLVTEEIAQIAFPLQKPPAFLTIDDRCIQFNGTWPDVKELLAFRPWNKQ